MSSGDCSTNIEVKSGKDVENLALLLLDEECRGTDVTVDWQDAISLTFPLRLPEGSSLTLVGSSVEESGIIGGETTFPLLTTKGSRLNLRSLHIFGGKAGGIVGSDSNVTVEQCIFEHNKSDEDGAAIRLEDGALDLSNCTFIDNKAVTSRGGALYTARSSLTISACNFTNNAAEFGGAIYASHAQVSDASFLGNKSKGKTGRGLKDGDPADDDSDDGKGGAIYMSGVNTTDRSVSFFGNSVCTESEVEGRRSRGGCIYVERGEIEIRGGELSNNSAEDQGGGIHVGRDARLHLFDTRLRENAARVGGGLAIDGDAKHVAIIRGHFSQNRASLKGGAVYVGRVSSHPHGGSRRLEVRLTGGSCEENSADESGGAMYVNSGVHLDITGGTYAGNSARYNGGGVWLSEASLTCSGATMKDNVANDEGGAIYAQAAHEMYSDCDIMGNSGRSGAAIYAVNSDLLTITGATLGNNTNARGGVLHVQNGTVRAQDVLFDEPQSRHGVCAIEVATEESMLEALNCTFSGWAGDTMIVNGGSSTFDECNFVDATSRTLVYSTSSAQPALVRNSRLGPLNYQNELSYPGMLVNGGATCDDERAVCAAGCVPGLAGVLCRCYQQVITGDMICLDKAGRVEVAMLSPPDATLAPDDVGYELNVSSVHIDTSASTGMVWYLEALPDPDVVTSIVPISGILEPGGIQTVKVVVSLIASAPLHVISGVLARGLYPQSHHYLPVNITYSQCPQYSYFDEFGSCEFCSMLEYTEGVDCSFRGASTTNLPIKRGYWRQTTNSLTVKQCPYPKACLGSLGPDSTIRRVRSTDDYCHPGSCGKYCAECAPGYAGHHGIACHKCDDGYYIASMAVLLSLSLLLIMIGFVLLVLYLVGGIQAVTSASSGVADAIRRSLKRDKHRPTIASLPSDEGEREREQGRRTTNTRNDSATTCPAPSLRVEHLASHVTEAHDVHTTVTHDVHTAEAHDAERAVKRRNRLRSRRLLRRLLGWIPFRKLRIMIVVWQILTQFPGVAYVSYPKTYANFLSYMDFINLNFVSMFSVSCIFPHINFYHELLAVTLLPLAMVLVMAVTFAKAYRETASNPQARQEAVARHASVGLLVAFLILSSASTTIVRMFMCESFEDLGGARFLKADYSLSCDTREYRAYRAYASLMILYYPIGIPVLFLSLLWANKDGLNPEIVVPPTVVTIAPHQVIEVKEATRASDPALQPTRILWGAYAPGNYTYEVVECGRRLLLTSALVMIEPGTTTQCALACVFAFLSLVAFELIMPYTSKDDAWLYRMGCMVIFFSNFLALMMKAKIANERQHHVYAILLVVVNVSLFFSIWFSAWVTAGDTADKTRNLIHGSLELGSTGKGPSPANTPRSMKRFGRFWRFRGRSGSRGVGPAPPKRQNLDEV